MPKVFKLNGLIYIIKSDVLLKRRTFFDRCIPFLIDKRFSLNLDNYEDLVELKKKL